MGYQLSDDEDSQGGQTAGVPKKPINREGSWFVAAFSMLLQLCHNSQFLLCSEYAMLNRLVVALIAISCVFMLGACSVASGPKFESTPGKKPGTLTVPLSQFSSSLKYSVDIPADYSVEFLKATPSDRQDTIGLKFYDSKGTTNDSMVLLMYSSLPTAEQKGLPPDEVLRRLSSVSPNAVAAITTTAMPFTPVQVSEFGTPGAPVNFDTYKRLKRVSLDTIQCYQTSWLNPPPPDGTARSDDEGMLMLNGLDGNRLLQVRSGELHIRTASQPTSETNQRIGAINTILQSFRKTK